MPLLQQEIGRSLFINILYELSPNASVGIVLKCFPDPVLRGQNVFPAA
jgi:hypothetical protein